MNIWWIFLVVTAKAIDDQYENVDQFKVKLTPRKY
jgi:hypothetical protein